MLPVDITRRYCPRGVQILEELRNSSTYRKIMEENRDFFAYISEKAGVSTPYTQETIAQLYNTVYVEVIIQQSFFVNKNNF